MHTKRRINMAEFESLSHSKWECKYRMAPIPKSCRKTLYAGLWKPLWKQFRQLAIHNQSRTEETHLLTDHEVVMISVPPNCALSQVIGHIKGKSANHSAWVYGGRKRSFIGRDSRAGGCFVGVP